MRIPPRSPAVSIREVRREAAQRQAAAERRRRGERPPDDDMVGEVVWALSQERAVARSSRRRRWLGRLIGLLLVALALAALLAFAHLAQTAHPY